LSDSLNQAIFRVGSILFLGCAVILTALTYGFGRHLGSALAWLTLLPFVSWCLLPVVVWVVFALNMWNYAFRPAPKPTRPAETLRWLKQNNQAVWGILLMLGAIASMLIAFKG
jgi:hypothetical protein